MGSPYPQLPDVSVVHPNVTRILGQNPGIMTLQGTNSYLVGKETGPRILIDTTGGEISNINQYVSILRTILESKGETPNKSDPPVSEILLTHWHPDHTEGIEAVQKLIKNLTPSKADFHLKAFKSPEGPNLKSIGYYEGPLNVLNEEMIFSPPGSPSIKLKPIFTPGHSVDHMCFAMFVDDVVECVFVGDLLLGFGTTIVLDLPAYLHSLEVLREFVIKCNNPMLCFLPAHGDVITDPLGKIEEYKSFRMRHLHKTREGILQNPSDTWLSEDKLIEQIYPTTGAKMKQMVGNNLRQCLFWHQANEKGFAIADPITVNTKERRTEKDFKAATAIARPGFLPDVLNEVWLWKWNTIDHKNSSQNNHKPSDVNYT